MYRMTILYGTPSDPAAFRSYYMDTHVPLARKMKGLTGWNLQWIDGHPDWILVAELYAESKAAMDAILASPEGKAASDDLANFVTGGVVFLTGTEEQVDLS
jgi:uncharacterized protein (TIGR02118 family)